MKALNTNKFKQIFITEDSNAAMKKRRTRTEKPTMHPELIFTYPREMEAIKLNGQPAAARRDTCSFSQQDETKNYFTHMVLGFLYPQKPQT